MSSPQEKVFDNLLLRQIILTKLEYIKYKEKLHEYVHDIVFNDVISKWSRYCSCELCRLDRNNLV